MTSKPSQKISIDYDGEFGPELQTVIPYAYYLSQHDALEETVSGVDTKCLYYFSESHAERYAQRRFITPEERLKKGIPNPNEHVPRLDLAQWIAPPYKTKFRNERFVWTKEPLVISNKFNEEWDGDPLNYIDLPELEQVLVLLKDKYQIIYCRALPDDVIWDGNTSRSFKDFDLISRYPEVLTMQQLHAENPDLSFNELQLSVYANCERFISVQGGNSVLASYFGGINIIYAIQGRELVCGDFNHFPLYAGTRIVPCRNKRDFLSSVETVYGKGHQPLAKWRTSWMCFRRIQKYRIYGQLSRIRIYFTKYVFNSLSWRNRGQRGC
jgi:hypothetical protein